MRHLNNILKISIILILLFVSISSIYAANHSESQLNDNLDDDFELDDSLDEDLDEDLDDDLDDDLDEDLDDDLDDDLGDDLEEDLDEDLDDDLDDNLTDDNYTDYDFLEFKIISYLHQYGNYTYFNWTESEHFISEYQIYLSNPANYTLNQSAEGYETYLKIFDSIISTFPDYNLTENQTEYLKFIIIYYLNTYGNVSANYTWDENQSFAKYTPFLDIATCVLGGFASGNATAASDSYYFKNSNTVFNTVLGNATDTNSTSNNNSTNVHVPQDDSGWRNIVLLILVVVFVAFIFI